MKNIKHRAKYKGNQGLETLVRLETLVGLGTLVGLETLVGHEI